jgi:hypothetical protein
MTHSVMPSSSEKKAVVINLCMELEFHALPVIIRINSELLSNQKKFGVESILLLVKAMKLILSSPVTMSFSDQRSIACPRSDENQFKQDVSFCAPVVLIRLQILP